MISSGSWRTDGVYTYGSSKTVFGGVYGEPVVTCPWLIPGELLIKSETLAWSGNPHAQEELDVATGLLEFVEDQFHCFDRRNAGQRAAENDDFVVFVRVIEEFLFAGAGALDIDRRIFPSINIERSGTRKEELLYHPDEYNKVVILRRALTGVPPVEAMELVLNKLKKTGSNIEFLLSMGVS